MNRTQYVAGGDIYPCRFIKQDTSAPFVAIQATANSAVIGISTEGTTLVPIDGFTNETSVFSARQGLPVSYFGEHDECLLVVAEQIAPGDYLVSDANGKGVKAVAGSTNIGAVALEPATAAGQKIRVRVEYQRTSIPS